jgi:hypothetical protein
MHPTNPLSDQKLAGISIGRIKLIFFPHPRAADEKAALSQDKAACR